MARRRGAAARLLLPLVVCGALAGGGWAVAGATSASASGTLTATFAKTSDWDTGYVGDFTVANAGSAVTSWTLSFDLAPGQAMTNSWNGSVTRTANHYVVTNATWNGSLSTGATAQFGFQATYSGAFVAPSDCLINGNPCTGSSTTTTTTTPTTTTTTTTAPPPTTTTTTTTVPKGGTGSGTTPPPPGVVAKFAETSDWGTGFTGAYTISDTGKPISSWTLKFTLPKSEVVTTAWSSSLSHSGNTYTLTNATWNGAVGNGTAVTIGFQGTYSYRFVAPRECTVNGQSCGTGNTATTATTPTPATLTLPPTAGSTQFPFAPYVDVTLDTPPFTMATDLARSGDKYYTLAFVVAASATQCEATWGTYYPTSSGYYKAEIEALRQKGGDVAISFGGENSTELATACTTVTALVAQYQSVIDEYHVSHIDFDIEGAAQTHPTGLRRRSEAIAQLESANPGLTVSFTLPVEPTGLAAGGLRTLDTAIANGVRVDLVNVMAMDFGTYAAPDPSAKMGTYVVEAAQSTYTQLAALYPTRTAAQLWKMIGDTPMLGVNDMPNEVFTLADARQLATFAGQVHLGRLAMWSATRDSQCPGGANANSADNCSSVVEQPFGFSTVLAGYTG